MPGSRVLPGTKINRGVRDMVRNIHSVVIATAMLMVVAAGTRQDARGELTVTPGTPGWSELYDPPYASPTEIPVSSTLRKSLFDQLRPMIEKNARQPVRFQGSLQAYRNWAFFSGRTVDSRGVAVALSEIGSSDTAALWIRTKAGWRLVEYSAGHTDVCYAIWPEQFGVPAELLGLQ